MHHAAMRSPPATHRAAMHVLAPTSACTMLLTLRTGGCMHVPCTCTRHACYFYAERMGSLSAMHPEDPPLPCTHALAPALHAIAIPIPRAPIMAACQSRPVQLPCAPAPLLRGDPYPRLPCIAPPPPPPRRSMPLRKNLPQTDNSKHPKPLLHLHYPPATPLPPVDPAPPPPPPQTDNSEPQKLISANVDVMKVRKAAAGRGIEEGRRIGQGDAKGVWGGWRVGV